MRVPDWLAQRAALSPGRAALRVATHARTMSELQGKGDVEPTEGGNLSYVCLTYADLDARVQRLSGGLRSHGVSAGDRVALLLPNSLDFVLATHAVPRCGAILVPLNLRLTPEELHYQLRDAEPTLLIHDAARATVAEEACIGTSVERATVDTLNGSSTGLVSGSSFDLEAPHSIVYTSGTTGRPKGAILTFQNFWWNATASALNLGIREGDRWLAVLPLFHVGGLSILLRAVIYGIEAEVHERFDPVAVNVALDSGATGISVVATMLSRILDVRGEVPYPSSLRYVLAGGGPIPRSLLQRCTALHVPAVQTYGLTETGSQAVTLAPEDALSHIGSAGKALFGCEVGLESTDGDGAIGEILIRGPIVTPGYWRRPEATSHAIRDDWLHTGDIGALDPDGYLFVLDRRDDLIVTGGENVYPAEVESVLTAHPSVGEACVIGLPDATWGSQVVAAIIPGGPTFVPDDILAFCREHLAGYKVPRRIVQVESLPRTASGKIRRAAMRESLESGALST